MKPLWAIDCVAVYLDYDAVKEVVQIVSGYPNEYACATLTGGEKNLNFALRITKRSLSILSRRGVRELRSRRAVGSNSIGKRSFITRVRASFWRFVGS